MDKFLKIMGAIFSVLILVLIAPLLGCLLGAFAGWIVGLFFEITILGIFGSLGIVGVKMWQIGLFLGFAA